VQWAEDEDENENKLIHDGYWHVTEGEDIESRWILDRKSAEMEAVIKIYSDWNRAPRMELVRMACFEEGQKYPQCWVQNNSYEYRHFVKEYLVKNNIKMTGAEHHEYGIPIIENNGKVYAFTLSYANWGRLMAEAFDPDNRDTKAFLKWAGERPEGEVSWKNPDMA